jgi:beta-glucoside PTS system EIICBA component
VNDARLAARLADLVGGPGNVRRVHTCATRLRFVVRDRALVRRDELGRTDGVAQVLEAGGQTQVVIGPNVESVRQELGRLPGWAPVVRGEADDAEPAAAAGSEVADEPRPRFLDRVFDLLAATFQPLLAPLIGASMIRMLLSLAIELGWWTADDAPPGVLVLTAASSAVFYFLPIFVAVTASRRLGANPYLAGAIAASLLDPSFLELGATGAVSDFFGVPLYVFGYSSSVFPAILVALALSVLEPRLRRLVPKDLQLVVVPTVSLLLLVPLAALVFGPFGVLVGEAIADALGWLDGISPVLLAVAVAGSFLFLVMFGLHWALVPIVLVNLDRTGSDPITAAMGAYNFAVWGLAVGVFLRARRDAKLRSVAGAGAVTGLLGGISEPMLYGVILRFRRVIPIVVGSAVVGGALIGLFGVRASAVAFSSLFTIPLMDPRVGYVVAIATSFVLALVGVLVLGYEGRVRESVHSPEPAVEPVPVDAAPVVLRSPLTGEVVPLADLPDPVFAGGLVGPGVAVVPSEGVVRAVADGTVVMAPPTGHAVGVRTGEGVEVLVHVGIDTVRLRGAGFRSRVVPGQRVTTGEVLVEFDLARLTEAGCPVASPVVVTNAAAYGPVRVAADGRVTAGEPLLTVARQREGAGGQRP